MRVEKSAGRKPSVGKASSSLSSILPLNGPQTELTLCCPAAFAQIFHWPLPADKVAKAFLRPKPCSFNLLFVVADSPSWSAFPSRSIDMPAPLSAMNRFKTSGSEDVEKMMSTRNFDGELRAAMALSINSPTQL